MSDIGGSYPIQITSKETKEMKLKWIAAQKQERKSKLVHLRQAIEDLMQGQIPTIERQIMSAQQEYDLLEAQEKMLQSSVEAEPI